MVQEVSFLFSCPRLLTLYFVMLCRSLHTHAYQKKNPNWLCRRQKVYVYETRACSKCEKKKTGKEKLSSKWRERGGGIVMCGCLVSGAASMRWLNQITVPTWRMI